MYIKWPDNKEEILSRIQNFKMYSIWSIADLSQLCDRLDFLVEKRI